MAKVKVVAINRADAWYGDFDVIKDMTFEVKSPCPRKNKSYPGYFSLHCYPVEEHKDHPGLIPQVFFAVKFKYLER